jgi:hypothetical protein
MKPRYAALALLLAALPAALSAEPWEKVDELPGGIAVELDRDSVFEALDGAHLVWHGIFRRENVGWIMESHVAVDCENETAKLRGMRLMDGAEVLTERSDLLAEFVPINAGSSEAIYYKALCGKEATTAVVVPEATEADAGIDLPPGEEAVAEDPGIDLVPAEADPEFDELFADLPLEGATGDAPE